MQIQNPHKKPSVAYSIVFLAILAAGLYLRFAQYLMGRSMWEDESHLALNVMDRSYIGLLKPLDYLQGAPVLFLWITKTFGLLFGYSEFSLRLFPFLASIATLPLFYYVSLELLQNRIAALMSFTVFSFSIGLVYFASEFKPYTIDISMFVLMIYLMLTENSFVVKHRNKILLLCGSLTLLVSISGFIAVFICGLFLAGRMIKEKKADKPALKILACWVIVFALNYFLFIFHHPSTEQQKLNYGAAFCPWPPSALWFKKTFDSVFFNDVLLFNSGQLTSWVVVILMLSGILHMAWNRCYKLMLFTIVPIALHLLLSMFHFYPFVFRLILYLMPAIFILLAAGALLLTSLLPKKAGLVAGTIICLFSCYLFSANSLSLFPRKYRDIKPALQYMNDSLAGEHLYVFDPVNTYTYYEKRGLTKIPVYRGLPWTLDSAGFTQFVSEENKNFVIMYNTHDQCQYGSVIRYLRRQGLVLKEFNAEGYGVFKVRSTANSSGILIDHTLFDQQHWFGEQRLIALWSNGKVTSKVFNLPAGNYKVSVSSYGSSAAGEFAHNLISINDKNVTAFYSTSERSTFIFDYIQQVTQMSTITLQLDNDFSGNGEDRNTLLYHISFTPVEQGAE